MPLPVDGQPWPLPEHADAHSRLTRYDAWYSGDPAKLEKVYLQPVWGAPDHTVQARRQANGGLVGFLQRMFWGRPAPNGQPRQKLHAPVAADIAAASSDLLFSEAPKLTLDEGSAATQDRLDTILDDNGAHATFLEAGEIGAALGGYGLRVSWDLDVAPDRPLLSAVHGDQCWPEYVFGVLRAITFWCTVEIDGQTVWRELERHEPGKVLHALYKGTPDKLGKRVPLNSHSATAALDDEVPGITGRLLATYVPNMLPNRDDRGSRLGRSDYAGVEPFMDALDETWTSWMRDIRLGKARLLMPSAYLESGGKGGGAWLDEDREVYSLLPGMMPAAEGDRAGMITNSQFEIRVQEHRDTYLEQLGVILRSAGYSARTFGLAGGEGAADATATEVRSEDRRSLVTRDRKLLYVKPELATIAETLLMVDALIIKTRGVEPARPLVEFPAAVQESPRVIAETVDLLKRAEAASVETRVRLVNPDWQDQQVSDEVRKILDETSLTVPDIEDFDREQRDEVPPPGE